MNLRYSLLFIFLMVSPIMAEHDSTAIHHDPWFAYDKVLHFGVSCSIVLCTHYVLSEKMNIHDDMSLSTSVIISMGNGIIKEVWDSRQPSGFISRRDIIADVAGIIAGIWIISL